MFAFPPIVILEKGDEIARRGGGRRIQSRRLTGSAHRRSDKSWRHGGAHKMGGRRCFRIEADDCLDGLVSAEGLFAHRLECPLQPQPAVGHAGKARGNHHRDHGARLTYSSS